VKALLEATKAKDRAALERIFGPAVNELCSGDAVQDAADFEEFSAALARGQNLSKDGEDKSILQVGPERVPFPIPLARKGGKWFFDTEAGKEEILNRRIGENELGAIRVCRGCVAAQYEYYFLDPDGDNVLQYAPRFRSSSGKKDGLYWETRPDEPPSPLGPLAAQASSEGYGKSAAAATEKPQPYHGYLYKLLTRQGEHAPGGKFDYVINGRMVAGFALVAYPVQYGSSGVMTFLVNSNGKLYQNDLGEKTAEIAGAMDTYDIDGSWTLVQD
jgi:hypothetical protein